jgi:peptidoglycan hydrolase-like protein with peptidoglycan-binding domain
MRKAALALTLVALAACNRQRTYESPQPTASTGAQDTWVAEPGDLSPEQVRMVQRALADRGFTVEPSGRFDDQTRTALNDFQRSRGLPETGNLNADTAAALGMDPNEVMPVRGSDETQGMGRDAPAGAPTGESGGPSGMSGSTGGSAPGGTSGQGSGMGGDDATRGSASPSTDTPSTTDGSQENPSLKPGDRDVGDAPSQAEGTSGGGKY